MGLALAVRREFAFTDGRGIARGKIAARGQKKRADYLLFFQNNLQLAIVEATLALDQFPSPDDLCARYRAWKGITNEANKVVTFPYYEDASGRELRYYQRIAVQRTIEAVARGQRRVLLAMSTGTGKTYTAFHIVWRLWKAGVVKRVLFLADRNILVEQTIPNQVVTARIAQIYLHGKWSACPGDSNIRPRAPQRTAPQPS